MTGDCPGSRSATVWKAIHENGIKVKVFTVSRDTIGGERNHSGVAALPAAPPSSSVRTVS
ncbi:hypothetical protein [Ciceribacter azotifigens]|uniref:hypothetical protein n=1 Tax=Ciceribacter azotifigens TaxID=2069303 RepID=UPI003A8B7867